MSVSSRWPRRSFRSYPLAMEVGTQTWKGSVGNVSVLVFIHERTWWSLIKLNSVIFPTLLSNWSTLVIITEYKIGSLFLPICSQIKILMLSAQVKRYLFFRGFISFCWSSTYRDQIDFFFWYKSFWRILFLPIHSLSVKLASCGISLLMGMLLLSILTEDGVTIQRRYQRYWSRAITF